MKQFVIIGLGTFGNFLATSLYEKGHEVLAIDKNSKLIQAIKDDVSRAVVADATDKKVLESLGVKAINSAIICMGSSLEASVLCALNLKDIGVKQIIAKATSEAHSRLLFKVGVSDVIFPEKDQAVTLSERLHNPSIIEHMPFVDNYSIVELAPPQQYVGKLLKDLNLINEYGIQVLAVKEIVPERMNMIPTGNFLIKDSDILIVLGPNDAIEKLKN
jgi:trk system potassium uptake protein TrkA